MSAFSSWALARLSEPSTYAGLATLVAGATFLPGADIDIVTKIIGAAAVSIPAILAVVKAEGAVK